jgi:spermidine synthase
LASYGRPGDTCDFIEINPGVIDLARQHFSFLKASAAEVQCIVGDGRLVLQRQTTEPYDLIVLDAFSSDSVPAHLLTQEAMELYRRRLAEQGVLVIHVTNRHLRLPPVVHRLAAEAGWKSALLRAPLDVEAHALASQWMVIADAANPIWNAAALVDAKSPAPEVWADAPLWTDQYHDLLSVVRLRSRS